MTYIYHVVIIIAYLVSSNSLLYKNTKDNVLSHIKKPSDVAKKFLRAGLEVDLEDFEDGSLVIPERNLQDDKDREEKRESIKKITKKTRFVPQSNFLDLLDESQEEVRKRPRYTHKKENKLDDGVEELLYNKKQRMDDFKDAKNAREKVKILKKAKKYEDRLNNVRDLPRSFKSDVGNERYHMDPVLNVLRSHSYRRRKKDSDDTSSSSSSSRELKHWKDEFKEHWEQKKWEALNQTRPSGDVVNMAAARPWGVPCGDPNQHDMPWGTCMLSIECEAEYRIYRGDFFCGRTQFVCCALQMTSYDLYQGIDASFDDKDLSTDSDEKKGSSSSDSDKKSSKKRRKRKRERRRRKKKIKKNIKRIVREIRKILSKHYKNGTRQRKRKTKQIKKFIKNLKKQYKKDREAVKDVHELEMIKIDVALMKRLSQIRDMNKNFMKNSTFRDIMVNGTATKQGVRMLVEAYPELEEFIQTRRTGNSGKLDDYLEYDIEYGFLYY